MSVSLPKQIHDLSRIASMVEKALDANQLAIDVSGELFVAPINTHPKPEKLPDTVIRGGVLEHDY